MARKSKDTEETATEEAKAAAQDAEQALEAVQAEAAAELPADDVEAAVPVPGAADAAARAAAEDADQALEAVQAEAAAELPADDVEAAVPVPGAEQRAAAAPAAAPSAPADEGGRANRRKVREGIVVSDSMSSTVVVAVVERVRHPKYGKTVQRTKKLYVHDAEDSAKVGDRVRVQETRPLSKLKRWRLTEVVERAR
jgi:small subunit ribosomal protein S17